MEKARCNTELYSNLRAPLNNVKPSNFWGSHHQVGLFLFLSRKTGLFMAAVPKLSVLSTKNAILVDRSIKFPLLSTDLAFFVDRIRFWLTFFVSSY